MYTWRERLSEITCGSLSELQGKDTNVHIKDDEYYLQATIRVVQGKRLIGLDFPSGPVKRPVKFNGCLAA